MAKTTRRASPLRNGAPVGLYRVDNIAVRDTSDRVVLRLTASDNAFADLVRDASVTVTADGNPQGIGQPTAAPLAPIAIPTTTAVSPTPANRPGDGNKYAGRGIHKCVTKPARVWQYLHRAGGHARAGGHGA